MAVTYNSYLSEVQLEVAKSFDAGYKGYSSQYEKIFRMDPNQRFEEKFSVRGGMSADLVDVADGAAYNAQNPKIVGTQTIEQLMYKESVAITKMMKEKDHYGSAFEDAYRLGYYAHLKMDKLATDILVNATGTTVTWDGLSLANASHLVGDTGATQDNTVTGALDLANLETAIQGLRTQVDHNNATMGISPSYLVVPTRNMHEALRLTESPMTPGDANTAKNVIQPLQVVVWDQLVTTNWEAMLVTDKMFHRLEYQLAYGPEITPDRDTATGNDLIQMDLACNAGAVDYLGTFFIV
jgi:phage major head subunit gpT-like protein